MNLKFITLCAIAAMYESEAYTPRCEDSSLPFKMNQKLHTCTDVAGASNTTDECLKSDPTFGDVNTHCPLTCGKCENNYYIGREDSNMRFQVLDNSVLKWKKCVPWAGRPDFTSPMGSLPNNFEECKRCRKTDVEKTCPVTCGLCAITAMYESEAYTPRCEDSSLPFKMNQKLHTCTDVAGVFNTTDECLKSGPTFGDVNKHCPLTCGKCENNYYIGREDSNMRFQVLDNSVLKWKNCGPWAGRPELTLPSGSLPNTNEECKRCRKTDVKKTCPVTCSSCPFRINPNESEAPSIPDSQVPSGVPSAAPSGVPSAAPSGVPSAA